MMDGKSLAYRRLILMSSLLLPFNMTFMWNFCLGFQMY